LWVSKWASRIDLQLAIATCRKAAWRACWASSQRVERGNRSPTTAFSCSASSMQRRITIATMEIWTRRWYAIAALVFLVNPLNSWIDRGRSWSTSEAFRNRSRRVHTSPPPITIETTATAPRPQPASVTTVGIKHEPSSVHCALSLVSCHSAREPQSISRLFRSAHLLSLILTTNSTITPFNTLYHNLYHRPSSQQPLACCPWSIAFAPLGQASTPTCIPSHLTSDAPHYTHRQNGQPVRQGQEPGHAAEANPRRAGRQQHQQPAAGSP